MYTPALAVGMSRVAIRRLPSARCSYWYCRPFVTSVHVAPYARPLLLEADARLLLLEAAPALLLPVLAPCPGCCLPTVCEKAARWPGVIS